MEEIPRRGAFHPPRQRGQRLATLATEQHGVVARRQLVALEFTRREIDRMATSGGLQRLHHGVYGVGHRALSHHGRWMAAVLACGPGALLSHRSGGALRQLRATSQSHIEVTVSSDRARRVAGVRTYRRQSLEPQDRDVRDGIPCTSLALTLLNLAAILDRRALERAIDEAEVQRIFDLRAIEEVLARSRGRRGAGRLRAVLDEHAAGTTLTKSELEELTLALCRQARLPAPRVNEHVFCAPSLRSCECDFVWPAHRLVLETDGSRFHSSRRQIERDRRKEADLVAAGYRVLRVSYGQVEREPDLVAQMLRAAFAA